MGRAVRFLATALAGWVIYLLLAMPVGVEELWLGLGAAVLSALLLAGLRPFDGRLLNPLRILRGIVYVPYFLWKMVAANLEMAVIILRPVLKISPSIVRADTELQSPEGKLLLTSSITLTPGTLSVDAEDQKVYVHRVTGGKADDGENRKEITVPFERFLKGVTE